MERHLLPAAWALLAAQLAHVVAAVVSAPGDDDANTGEGVIGLPLGLLAIIVNVVAIVGLRRGDPRAPLLVALTGFSVAVGFVVYHGLPWHSWATNPYWGIAGVVDWLSVAVCVVAGAWCAWAGWPRATSRRSVPAATATP